MIVIISLHHPFPIYLPSNPSSYQLSRIVLSLNNQQPQMVLLFPQMSVSVIAFVTGFYLLCLRVINKRLLGFWTSLNLFRYIKKIYGINDISWTLMLLLKRNREYLFASIQFINPPFYDFLFLYILKNVKKKKNNMYSISLISLYYFISY